MRLVYCAFVPSWESQQNFILSDSSQSFEGKQAAVLGAKGLFGLWKFGAWYTPARNDYVRTILFWELISRKMTCHLLKPIFLNYSFRKITLHVLLAIQRITNLMSATQKNIFELISQCFQTGLTWLTTAGGLCGDEPGHVPHICTRDVASFWPE